MTRLFGGSRLQLQRAARAGLVAAGFCAAIALCATPAHAQVSLPVNQTAANPGAARVSSDFGPTADRILSDPLFLPRAGQAYGASAFTLDRPSGTNTKAGVETGSFTASDRTFDQTLAYGITNTLTVRMAMGYAANTRDSTSAATGDVTVGNASGFSDQTFSATYRLLDGSRSSPIFDVTGSYSPNVFAAETAGSGLNGTVGRGGQTAGASMAFGRETASFTIAGTAAATYVGQQTTRLLSNSTSTQTDAHWSYEAGLATQTRITNRISLNAGVAYSLAASYGVSNLQTGNAHRYEPPATIAATLGLNYHLVSNRLVASLTYAYDAYTEARNVFANPASDTAVTNRTGHVIGARFVYLFN